MTNAEINTAFFAVTDAKAIAEILGNIAAHYGITKAQALEEVTDAEAEHLLDYVTEPMRSAASVLFQRHRTAP